MRRCMDGGHFLRRDVSACMREPFQIRRSSSREVVDAVARSAWSQGRDFRISIRRRQLGRRTSSRAPVTQVFVTPEWDSIIGIPEPLRLRSSYGACLDLQGRAFTVCRARP